MSEAITIRLNKELSAWLEATAARTGVSPGQIVCRQLEKARAASERRPFLKLAGVIRGPKRLSQYKGFSRA